MAVTPLPPSPTSLTRPGPVPASVYADLVGQIASWNGAIVAIKARVNECNPPSPTHKRRPVLYDGVNQNRLADLDAEIRRGRTKLHKARKLARATLVDDGVLQPDGTGTASRLHVCPDTNTTLAYSRTSSRTGSRTGGTDHPTLKMLATIDSGLETAQTFVGAAASRLLRDGQCRKELVGVRRALHDADALCRSRLAELAEQAEKAAQRAEYRTGPGRAGGLPLPHEPVRSAQDSFSLDASCGSITFRSGSTPGRAGPGLVATAIPPS